MNYTLNCFEKLRDKGKVISFFKVTNVGDILMICSLLMTIER